MLPITHRWSLPVLVLIFSSLALRVLCLGHHDLLTEEAYYWNYSIHLDFGYLDHPPLVALMIRGFTSVFGDHEWAIRCPALLSWALCAYFSYRWTELIRTGSGQYATLLLSILPFFFFNSCMTTPDMPLLAAWSGGLYYLYQALCLNKSRAWYGAGLSIGLGLVAKYSIALLVMTAGLYLVFDSKQRHWLTRKEPYLAAVIGLVLFSPVIYWNAVHDWLSFAFQSTRRLQGSLQFTLHHLIGILILFLTPLGIIGCIELGQRSHPPKLNHHDQRFIQIFLLGPLLVFALFSCCRPIKLDWIGPCLLAVLPWLASIMAERRATLRHWLRTSSILIPSYALVLFCICYGEPTMVSQRLFSPLVTTSWSEMTHKVHQLASRVALSPSQPRPILVPLDSYRIESELTFYQHQQWVANPKLIPFPVHHAGIFGISGLMFEKWDTPDLQGKTVILISRNYPTIHSELIQSHLQALAPIHKIWTKSKIHKLNLIPYYYQIAKIS